MRIGARRIVFAIDQLFTIGRLNALIAKLQARQLNADERQQTGAHQRPDDRGDNQPVRHLAHYRQFFHVRRERHQHRQKGNQRHHGFQQRHAHIFNRGGETHGVFLHTLRGAFDMAQPRPVFHVIFVHGGTPAEDVVADEKIVQHAHGDVDKRNAKEHHEPAVKLADFDFIGRAERGLDQVKERRIPGVNGDRKFHHKPGDENQQRRTQHRPALPAVRAIDAPEGGEQPHAKRVVGIEKNKVARPETGRADGQLARHAKPFGKPAAAHLPDDEGQHRPDQRRKKKSAGTREKGFKHQSLLQIFLFLLLLYSLCPARAAGVLSVTRQATATPPGVFPKV
ncbi:hypothetical protein BN128_4062 [Cronobacter sakazakii 696]|nr:hypothetical protein BN128_4062 [Cronobacter sakazakii 696]